MTRKELEPMGLSKENVDAIIKINGDDIENAKTAANTAHTTEIQNLQTEITGLKGQVKERDTQLETLKSSTGDAEAMKTQIADLQAENTKTKETHESEMNQLKIDFAVEKALTGANAKNAKTVRPLLDLTDAKLDKDGNVKGLQEQIDKLVADDGTKFLFEAQQSQNQQTFKGFQPGVSGSTKPGTEVDTSKMNYDELCAYLAENPDANLSE